MKKVKKLELINYESMLLQLMPISLYPKNKRKKKFFSYSSEKLAFGFKLISKM